MTRERAVRAATAIYLVFVAVVTLTPQPAPGRPPAFVMQVLALLHQCGVPPWFGYDELEFSANIALFVPVGALLAWWWGRERWWLVGVVGFAMTVTIEVVQFAIPGRFPDLRDVVANTLGTLVGLGVTLALQRWTGRSKRRPRARPSPGDTGDLPDSSTEPMVR